jgi:hypothetical protein
VLSQSKLIDNNGLTASFLNHFLTSVLTTSHSLSATLVNLEYTSVRDSKMIALAVKVFTIVQIQWRYGDMESK